VVVAVVAVGVMEMVAHEVIDMVAVGHCFVPAVVAVDVLGVVVGTAVAGRAAVGVLGVDLQDVLVDVVPVGVVEMAVVHVVDVVGVRYGRVPAAGCVVVGVVGMCAVLVHVDLFLRAKPRAVKRLRARRVLR
jgi:hypothetical protein